MKRDSLIQLIVITRYNDSDGVSFEAFCPYGCDHTDFSVVHYGEEDNARNATIGKMINHCVRDHDIILDREDMA